VLELSLSTFKLSETSLSPVVCLLCLILFCTAHAFTVWLAPSQ
jgi:hypothetical protein